MKIALRLLRWSQQLWPGIRLFFTFVFAPFVWIGRGVFRFILLPMYAAYMRIKQRLKTSPYFAGIQSVGHFFERYALHAALVLIGVLGLGHNLFARTIRPDEIGRGALWTSYVVSENSDVIVDATPSTSAKATTSSLLAVGGTPGTIPAAVASLDQTGGTDADAGAIGVGSTEPTPATGTATRQSVIEYTVQGGDTIGSIATQYNITGSTIRWANGITNDLIKPGQVLKIPPVSGVLYTVQSGDTLAGIAQKYGSQAQSILDENRLISADQIQVGQELIIPGGQPPAPPAPAPAPRSIIERIFAGNVTPPPSAPGGNARFIWPTTNHHINQYFRGSYHTGIDIEGDYSSPIYAAAAGTVVFASYDRSGYGLRVVIDHGNGYDTLYGHASKVFVGVGDTVKQGQTIAMVGSTGRSTGTHLHFEVRRSGGFVNPLIFF